MVRSICKGCTFGCGGAVAWLLHHGFRWVVKVGVFGLLASGSVQGAVVFTETWDTSDEGWLGSTGDAVVQHDASGNPGGSMGMSFADSLFPLTDGFFADGTASSGNFVGSYLGITGFQGWRFELNPLDILPSSIYLRLNGNGNTYLYNVASQVTSLSGWNSVTVSAASGWVGFGGMAGFNAALASVSWLELTLTTSGSDAQTFYLDNFETYASTGGGGGPGSAVPEPNVLLAYVLGCVMVYYGRRRFA